jgi:hypothetical protein
MLKPTLLTKSETAGKKGGMHTKTFFQQFRQKLYQILPKRADATLDFIDALTVAGHVTSPVALSEEAPFRRRFVNYDV